MPFYLGELTEKIVSEDRIQCLKLSQDRLKVGSESGKKFYLFNEGWPLHFLLEFPMQG